MCFFLPASSNGDDSILRCMMAWQVAWKKRTHLGWMQKSCAFACPFCLFLPPSPHACSFSSLANGQNLYGQVLLDVLYTSVHSFRSTACLSAAQ